MSTSAVAPAVSPKARARSTPIQGVPPQAVRPRNTAQIDRGLILGIVMAFGATIAGISATAIGLSYFLQPAGALIVLGGTIGVILITTPGHALLDSARRVKELFSAHQVDREALIEEIVQYARVARRDGLLALEPLAHRTSTTLLRDAILLGLDVPDRMELRTLLEAELRLRERQGELDAKILEVAGGFAPTIGILGTVVGLIAVLRHFSNAASVGHGIGTAFVSTIYGLTLANLVLLPLANRIRARVADLFEVQELIMESVLALVDGVHPMALRQRLTSFLRSPANSSSVAGAVVRLKPLESLRINGRIRAGRLIHGS
ncbi:MAG: MotA/TolQ/ExbB proton channel family protein [Bryobacteraceae bacterium]